MTDKAVYSKPPRRAGRPADTEGLRQFGLAAAMALIAGSTFVKFADWRSWLQAEKTTIRKEMSWLP